MDIRTAYQQTKQQIGGHGKLTIQMLTEAFSTADEDLASDTYGKGNIIEEFQHKMAEILGKEAAVFFPSGTMAQQIALRIWCDERGLKKAAYHPLCHLEIHEENGLKELHQIESILIADESRVIELQDVMNIKEEISCLLLELPQREIGGQLPKFETLEAIAHYCREKEIKLHLDGARLFEVLPYYQKTAAEVCSLFDSVYVSFYKGIGGIAGAVLAGSKEFTEKSKVWKRRHGGDLISLYPYIISSEYFFNRRIGKMGEYYEQAKELAGLLNQYSHISTLPKEPVSNMFHVYVDGTKEEIEPIFINLYQETGIGITSYLNETGKGSCSFELSIGDQYSAIPKEKVHHILKLLHTCLKG